MKRMLFIGAAAFLLAACQTGPSEVTEKVLQDFGLKERPEGYVSGADRVFERLDEVGQTELKRMNQHARHGEIKFQEDGLRGAYYKEVKLYEAFYPLDAQPITNSTQGDRGFVGYIEYAYRVYQGPRKATRVEAAAEDAQIPTDEAGRETFRYTFTAGGSWDGGKGEKSRR